VGVNSPWPDWTRAFFSCEIWSLGDQKKGGGGRSATSTKLVFGKNRPKLAIFQVRKKVEITMEDFNKIPLFSMTKFDKSHGSSQIHLWFHPFLCVVIIAI
jgi:hypothetical protein